jgi:fumarate reductase subunit D
MGCRLGGASLAAVPLMPTPASPSHRLRIEPGLWLLFSAGGMASALVMPVLIVIFGVAIPMGWLAPLEHARLSAMVLHPLTRLVVFGVCALSLFHWAHRFKYTLYDGLQIKHLNGLLNALCYGGALVGTLLAGYVLARL